MSTYLLTWKPQAWRWEDLDECVAASDAGEIVEEPWSCGNRRTIKEGERVFLLKQGSDSPGLIGSGWVTRASYLDWDWDQRRRKQSRKVWYVNVDWDAIVSTENRLRREVLLNGLLEKKLVNTQVGGVLIDPQTALRLEATWARHRNQPLSIAGTVTATLAAWEGEPVEHTGYRRVRDRRLRDLAMQESKGVCAVCDTDYSRVLEGMGLAVLQVHHVHQIGYRDKPRLTSISDLAVVCANCHSLIHFDRQQAMSISSLKRLLRQR